jgi:arsenate reductase
VKEEAAIFKAMSEEVRLRIMILLTHGERRVQDLVGVTGLPQSTISRHLAYLKNNRLLVIREEGTQSFYGINRSNDVLVRSILGCLESCFLENKIARRDIDKLRSLSARTDSRSVGGNAVRILFVCVHNAARSQMAEAYTRKLGGAQVVVASAGLEPGALNPMVIAILKEKGISLTGCRSKSVHDLISQGQSFDYVITVCAESEGARCPVFPGKAKRIHWEFEDPADLKGSEAQKLKRCRQISDRIAVRVKKFLSSIFSSCPDWKNANGNVTRVFQKKAKLRCL